MGFKGDFRQREDLLRIEIQQGSPELAPVIRPELG